MNPLNDCVSSEISTLWVVTGYDICVYTVECKMNTVYIGFNAVQYSIAFRHSVGSMVLLVYV